MAATTVTAATRVPTALPKVAACPKCNVILVPVQVKHASVVGELLAFVGLLSCFFNLVGGLVLVGFGIFVSAVGWREPGLMCPNCGTHAATLSELTTKVMAPPRRENL